VVSNRPARTGAAIGVALVGAMVFSGCASSSSSAGPTWVPQPAYTLEPTSPDGAGGGGAAGPTTSSPPPGSTGATSGPTDSPSPVADPAVVATGLTAPIGIAVLPSGSALVGQRTSGTIVQVQPTAGQPVTTVRTIAGLDAAGDGGLLDLAISPTYTQDHLIYAYVTTATDNRVVDFTLTGPITPVFAGIPKAATGNAGRIAFDPTGNLLIGTGDAGNPALAQDPHSLAGKVLEVNPVGQPVLGTSPIVSQGQHALSGLCVDSASAAVFETEPSQAGGAGVAATRDEVNLIAPGRDFGWPSPTPSSVGPAATLPLGTAGLSPLAAGCAVSDGVLYVASLDGTALYGADIAVTSPSSVKVDTFSPSLIGTYGRLITVVADPDGSLWLATANVGVTPAAKGASPADERILHIQPSGGGAGSVT
jgi:glucose/arabinose dehydrogenase